MYCGWIYAKLTAAFNYWQSVILIVRYIYIVFKVITSEVLVAGHGKFANSKGVRKEHSYSSAVAGCCREFVDRG